MKNTIPAERLRKLINEKRISQKAFAEFFSMYLSNTFFVKQICEKQCLL